MNPLPLFSPRRISQKHWQSVPEGRRRLTRVLTYVLAVAGAVPIVTGWARVGDVGTAAVAATAGAIAALLFGLGIQVFGMAAEIQRPQDHPERQRMIEEAERLRGLLANVLHCTLWAGASSLMVGVSAFVGWLWPARSLLGAGVFAFILAFVSFVLTVRRLFDEAESRLDRAYDTPVDRSKQPRSVP